jgi:sarcosine oxidase subunit beta
MRNMSIADVIVIGGGVHGAALSYELARAGQTVTLLERDTLASGASGGTGLRGVRANDRDIRELPLMRIAYDIWPTLYADLGRDPGYRQVGGLYLFEADTSNDPLAMARIRARVMAQNAHGIHTELIDATRLRDLEPGVSELVVGAVYTPFDGVGDHTATTRAYADAGRRHGVQVIEHTAAMRIKARGDHGGEVLTKSGERYCAGNAVVVLSNSYAPALLAESFGLELPVWRYNPQMTHARAQDAFTLRHLIGHVTRQFSAKTIEGDLVMLSGGRSGFWDESLDSGRPDSTVTDASLTDAGALFHDLIDAQVVATDASRPDSVSVDQIPIIDRVPSAPSVYFATGWSGHGFAIAPGVARLLARWVRTGIRPRELAPFELARLAAPPASDGARESIAGDPTALQTKNMRNIG